MSKQASIIAICQDGQDAAESFDGSTWTHRSASTSQKWKFISGDSSGRFVYSIQDLTQPSTNIAYSITDGTNWHGGILPNPFQSCFIAIADNDPLLYASYNGTTFNLIQHTYYIECDAKVTSNCLFGRSPSTYARTIIAIAHSTAIPIGHLAATRVVNLITATVSSIVSSILTGSR